ncbi:hypothetical protein Mapa_006837 [Marchantia paleacea]|nr:hypothetical protein Mapa_006837 [Marchantia paleacea]
MVTLYSAQSDNANTFAPTFFVKLEFLPKPQSLHSELLLVRLFAFLPRQTRGLYDDI